MWRYTMIHTYEHIWLIGIAKSDEERITEVSASFTGFVVRRQFFRPF
jgi:hypothetical protein